MTEIQKEQAVVNSLYQRLDNLQANAEKRIKKLLLEDFSFNNQALSERDSYVTHLENLILAYKSANYRLVFGRLDYDNPNLHQGKTHYIGRLGLTDIDGQVLLVDWRSSVGSDFYQATAIDPRHVERRRHIQVINRKVLDVEDELLEIENAKNEVQQDHVQLSGEGAIMAAMNQNRTDKMNDIVATIQKEQDEIIRAPFNGVHIVQGGAGTGKTAVALHRIAYLLYNNRETIKNNSILIIGPSQRFLEYIDQVLPSLGETGTVAKTILEVCDLAKPKQKANQEEVEIKGNLKMSSVIENAVNSYVQIPKTPVKLSAYDITVQLTPQDFARSIQKARKKDKKHNHARVDFVESVLNKVMSKLHKKYGEQFSESQYHDFQYEFRNEVNVRETLNRIWMPLDPVRFVVNLFKNEKRLRYSAKDILTEDEIQKLLQFSKERDKDILTDADIPLVDEANYWIGDDKSEEEEYLRKENELLEKEMEYAREVLKGVAYEQSDYVSPEMLVEAMSTALYTPYSPSAKYQHIVIDEAQELSEMEYRMLFRKSLSHSFTIVGDIAQTSSPAGVKNWQETIEKVVNEDSHNSQVDISVKTLSVNYRNPKKIADLAVRVAEANNHPVTKTDAPREVDECIFEGKVSELDSWIQKFANKEPIKKTAVINSENIIETKGLEYDNVILVEPADFEKISDLYVAITRATQKLVILHDKDLPNGFTERI
ncbi:MAG: AAA family ATPase [Candidatus Ancillula sp.]|jgi:DNA helicase IV|nr:AAA family ATPase [Candidatus Ancillula sp.]